MHFCHNPPEYGGFRPNFLVNHEKWVVNIQKTFDLPTKEKWVNIGNFPSYNVLNDNGVTITLRDGFHSSKVLPTFELNLSLELCPQVDLACG